MSINIVDNVQDPTLTVSGKADAVKEPTKSNSLLEVLVERIVTGFFLLVARYLNLNWPASLPSAVAHCEKP